MRSQIVLLALTAGLPHAHAASSRPRGLPSLIQQLLGLSSKSHSCGHSLHSERAEATYTPHDAPFLEQCSTPLPGENGMFASPLKRRDMFDDFSGFTSRAASFLGVNQQTHSPVSTHSTTNTNVHAVETVEASHSSGKVSDAAAQPAPSSALSRTTRQTATQRVESESQSTHINDPPGSTKLTSGGRGPTTTSTLTSTSTSTSTITPSSNSRSLSRSVITKTTLSEPATTQSTITLAPAASQTISQSTSSSGPHISVAAIAALSAVVVLVALSVIAVIFCLCRRRRRRGWKGTDRSNKEDDLLRGAAKPGFGRIHSWNDRVEEGWPVSIAMADRSHHMSHQPPAQAHFRNRESSAWVRVRDRDSSMSRFPNPLGLHRPTTRDLDRAKDDPFRDPVPPLKDGNSGISTAPPLQDESLKNDPRSRTGPPILQLQIPVEDQPPPRQAYRSISSLYREPIQPQQGNQGHAEDPAGLSAHNLGYHVGRAEQHDTIPRSLTPGGG